MRHPIIRWFLSLPAAMFYCLTASSLYEALGSPAGAPALAAVLASLFFLSSLGLWILSDARRRHRSLPYDFGAFVFFAWPLVAPVYLVRTRGWRAVIPLGWFILIYLAAALFGNLPFPEHFVRQ